MYQYSKPALTIDQQIDLLVCRGMFIPDRVNAKHDLSNISYYLGLAPFLLLRHLNIQILSNRNCLTLIILFLLWTKNKEKKLV